MKESCLRKYGTNSRLHQNYFHGVTHTYGTSFGVMKGQRDKVLQGGSCIGFAVGGYVQNLECGQR